MDKISVHGKDNFLIIIRNHAQWPEFPFPCFRRLHAFCNLNINFIVGSFRYKIHFCFPNFSDINAVITSHQFQKDNIFKNMSPVRVTIPQKHIPKSHIYDIVFPKRFQQLFPFYIIAPNRIYYKRAPQHGNIFLHRFPRNIFPLLNISFIG